MSTWSQRNRTSYFINITEALSFATTKNPAWDRKSNIQTARHPYPYPDPFRPPSNWSRSTRDRWANSRHSCRLTTDNLTSLFHTTTTTHRNIRACNKHLQHTTKSPLCSQRGRLTKAPTTRSPRAISTPIAIHPQNKHRNVRLASAQRAQAQQQRQASSPRRSSRRKGNTHPTPSHAPPQPHQLTLPQSSLVLRFVNDAFEPNKEPTIGAAFLTQKCNLPNRTIKFEIWDTAGQERFASLAPMYYRNAQSALVVYDITKASSLVKAKHWVAELQRQASPGIVIALVGNKLDLVEDEEEGGEAVQEGEGEGEEDDGKVRRVSTKEGKDYADEEGLLFFETSAKTGHNVNEVFTAIANAIPETSLKGPRGAAGGATQAAIGGGAQENSRVNLNANADAGPKEGCAC